MKKKYVCAIITVIIAVATLSYAVQSWINTREITLITDAFDAGELNTLRYNFDNGDNWQVVEYAPEIPITLPDQQGIMCIYVQVGDAAGNWSEAKSACAVMDTVPPVIRSILIRGK